MATITTPILTPKLFFPLGVQFDHSATSGYEAALSTYSYTHYVNPGGQNRLLIVAVSIFATGSVSTITYNGKKLLHYTAGDVTSGVYRSEIWYIAQPDTGSNTVVVTLSTSLTSIANSESYINVDGAIPLEAAGTNSGIAGTVNVSVTPLTNKSRVFANLAIASASGITSVGGQSPRTNNSGALGTAASDDKGIIDTAASTTLTWNGTGVTDHWAASAVSIRPFSAPVGYAAWLAQSVGQPYFTPYDINQTAYPVNVGTYFRPPAAPRGAAAWLGESISQPFARKLFIPPYDVNTYVYPANPITYSKAPTVAFVTTSTISQPIGSYPAHILGVRDPITYSQRPIPPTGAASWLPRSIGQPYFTPYDVNGIVYPANEATYYRAPAAPAGAASWFGKSISQPYIVQTDINEYLYPPPESTYAFRPPPPVPESEWLPLPIEQPYFTPYNENTYVYPANPITYTNRPPAPAGAASWLARSVNQPYIVPFDINSVRNAVDASTLRGLTGSVPPTGFASWASQNISQPYTTPTNNNSTVFNLYSLRSLATTNALITRMLLGMGL